MEKFRLHPLLKLLLYAILPLILLLTITWVALDILGNAVLEREIAVIKAAGEPVYFSEFAPPMIPDEENAAICYEQALSLIPTDPYFLNGLSSYIEGRNQETPEFIQSLREGVEKNRAILDLLSEGSRRPQCRYTIDYSAGGLKTKCPDLLRTKNCRNLLSAEVIIQTKNNQADEALKTCYTNLKFVNSLKEPPALITLMIKIACLDESLNVLKWLLNQDQPGNPEILRQILEELNPEDLRRSLAKAFQAEQCSSLDVLEMVRTGNGLSPWGSPSLLNKLYYSRLGLPIMKKDAALSLGLLAKTVVLVRKPYYAIKADLEKLKRDTENMPFYAVLTKLNASLYDCSIDTAHGEANC